MKNILKIASLLAAAVVLFSCEEKIDADATLRIVSDKDVIQANGQDAATLRVMYGDKDVTAESKINDDSHAEVVLNGGKFTASEVGEYKFYADYGAMTTYDKKDPDCFFVIKAIDVAVPEAVEDPQPQNKSFVHRTLLTQYTGTDCPNCPRMIKLIRDILAEGLIPNKAVHVAVHSYSAGDPAYISAPKAQAYPYLTLDHVQGFNAANGLETLKTLVGKHSEGSAKAGISVSPKYYEEDGILVVKVAVKAAVDGLFNVGAWLLEDEIEGLQSDNSGLADESYSIHENCVRIADSKYSGTWFGHLLGDLKAGQVAEKTFVMNVKPDWKVENLHLAVFTSYGEVDGFRTVYTTCNAIDAPIDAPTPFEYEK